MRIAAAYFSSTSGCPNTPAARGVYLRPLDWRRTGACAIAMIPAVLLMAPMAQLVFTAMTPHVGGLEGIMWMTFAIAPVPVIVLTTWMTVGAVGTAGAD